MIVLANHDYETHTSSEGEQLQRGLAHAGWTLCGPGYGDGCADIPELLRRYDPRVVLISDRRDWDPASMGSFRKDLGFTGIGALAEAGVYRVHVLKDAGSCGAQHRRYFREAQAHAGLVYYDPRTVRRLNPWLGGRPLVRTWHTIDREACRALDLQRPRKRAVITGATSRVYPLRSRLMRLDPEGLDVVGHPGYSNTGTHTPNYLRLLAGYRVHVATSSRFGFALRKIIESVAIGTTPVTDLPPSDVLPEIDGALLRIPPNASIETALEAVARADAEWNLSERLRWAEKARSFYDWRAMGERNSTAILEAAGIEAAA